MKPRYCLHYSPDNASLIIRLALEEMGLPYDTVLVDRGRTAQRSPEYLQLNPAGRIPTLETPDGPISETAAILLWLADRHGALAPTPDAPDRAGFLNWLFFVSNTLHTETVELFYIHRYGPEPAWPDMRAALQKRIARHLDILEQQARVRIPDWLCADTPSVLDLYTAAILRWLQIYPSNYPRWYRPEAHPALAAMCARLELRPSTAALVAAEGLGPHPFTDPHHPNPPEGSAT